MRLLIDTHTFIWWASIPKNLSPRAFRLCQDGQNTILLSYASIWEMQIKLQLEKLILQMPLQVLLDEQQKNGLILLPIEVNHILNLGQLPHYHRDPFDRLLISQAMTEKIPIISRDSQFKQYRIETIWE